MNLIPAQQINCLDNNQEENISFDTNYRTPDINGIYRHLYGYHFKRHGDEINHSTTTGLPIESYLEQVDTLRIPLAEKRLDGLPLTDSEISELSLLDSMTDFIMSRMVAEHEEPMDVKLALEYALKFAQD